MLPALMLVAVAAVAVGCRSQDMGETIVVSAAASLGTVFEEMVETFEVETPGVKVELNIGGSSSLREQILGGAPVSVFAAADERAMDAVVRFVDSGAPVVFATNTMILAVPPGNPAAVTSIADLADPNHFVGLCVVPVPCGVYSRQVLENADVDASIDTEESDVNALALKIELAEIDVGIVYQTDVRAREGRIEAVALPADINVTATYPILAVDGESPGAEAFVDFVLSDRGRQILIDHGFGTP